MAIPSFYHPELKLIDSKISLSEGEALHAAKSRRLRVDDSIRLFNGLGMVAHANILSIDKRKVSASIRQCEQYDRPDTRFSIATAIPKGDRQKTMLDMLTQLGVSEIIPLDCERGVVSYSQNMADKWRRVMVEACKQSQNPWLPTLATQTPIESLVEQTNCCCVYADAEGKNSLKVLGLEVDTTILIGPEGGFSPTEFECFKNYSLPAVKLGGYILRTEAAAIAAASQYNSLKDNV